jgi:hypothetical protein
MMIHNDQVHDEPIAGDSGEIKKNTTQEDKSSSSVTSDSKEETTDKPETPDKDTHVPESPPDMPEVEVKSEPEAIEEPEPEAKSEVEAEPEAEAIKETEPEATPDLKAKPEADATSDPETDVKPEPVTSQEPKPEAAGKLEAETKPEPKAKSEPKAEPVSEAQTSTVVEFDYSTLTREDLVNRLEILLDNQSVHEIKNDVDHIKINFYKKNKAEIEQKRKRFVEEGGDIEDFLVQADTLEERIKDLFKRYRNQKAEYNRNLESEKQENLKKKYEVIEKIKELINSKESINKTFHEFRDLQHEWRTLGLVPQQNLKDLWDTYNHHVEKFYDYIKINKELRDLDLKKNFELKIQLCEKAEELLLEPSVINAFKTLQKYHDQWREIGPVTVELRTEIWERFKEATSKINRKHQEHFEGLKKAQKKNLEQKALLCEQAEEITNLVLQSHKQWDEKSKEIIEIQKVWKTIGFAPKKDNNRIYERFRLACDSFFTNKREFYAQNKENQLNNLQLKTDLCIQAEALKDSTEWNKSTEDLIHLQKKWKEIGPVPKKQSDAVWRRFRAACDHFFNKKSDHYQNIDQTYSQNLEAKNKLLEEVNSFVLTDNIEENFKIINDFQRRWSEIGFVPFKEKDNLQEKFRQAINKHFDNLDINDGKRNLLKFKNKLNNMRQKPKADVKMNQERERFMSRLQQLRNDIVLWENNIGFFTSSKNAESMIEEVQNKINNAKDTIILLEQKIEMIDSMDTYSKGE